LAEKGVTVAGKMSNYLEGALLARLLGLSSPTPLTLPISGTLYLGVCTADPSPSDGTTYTEVSSVGTAYARRPITFNAASAGSIVNTAAITFAKATADWGMASYWIISDSLTGGNVLFYGPVNNPMSVLANEQFEIDVNQLNISLTGSMTVALANAALNSILRGAAWTPAVVTHVALLSAVTDDTTWTEVADSAYGRQPVTWGTITDGVSSNSGRLQWNAAAAQYTAQTVALFTALTSGTMLFRTALIPTKTVGAGKNFRFEIGDLQVKLD
jgi:hypothetical protein